MGIRTRGRDIKANAVRSAADKAVRAEAEAVLQRWNDQLALGRDMLSSPTIPAAPLAGTPGSRHLSRRRRASIRAGHGRTVMKRAPRGALRFPTR